MAILACAGLAAVAVAGYLLGQKDTPSAPTANVVDSGALELKLPADWQAQAPDQAIRGVALRDAVAAGPDGSRNGGITAGRTARTGKDFLPAGLTAASDAAAEPVRLGRYEAYRHRGLKKRGSGRQITAYSIPIEGGAAVVACHATSGAERAFMRECERVASTIGLQTLRPLPGSAVLAERRGLAATIARLRRRRAAGRRALARARTATGQARLARALGATYAGARRSFARLDAAPEPPGWKARVLVAMRRIERSYGRLARAARRRSRTAYITASRSVRRSERMLARLLVGASASR